VPITDGEPGMSQSTTSVLRIEVLDLRIRLERLAAAAFDRSCRPAERGRQSCAKHRLLCLLDGVPEERLETTHRLIHLGAHVIERSSDVLHGRLGMINLPPVVVAEWRTVVEGLEALGRRRSLAEPPDTARPNAGYRSAASGLALEGFPCP